MENIGILFSDFGPYHIARIEALASSLESIGKNLIAFRITNSSTIYSWEPEDPKSIKIVTLANNKPTSNLDAFKIAISFRKEIKVNSIKAIFLPSYSPLTNYLCFMFAKNAGCKTIMMNESWAVTSRSSIIGSFIKRKAVRSFDSALVGGTPQAEYANMLGMPKEKIFLGYDVVDNDYYIEQTKKWKNVCSNDLPIKGLPQRYFLNIGRFVYKKNLIQLVTAFCNNLEKYPNTEISLVLVGEGGEENSLRSYALSRGIFVRNGIKDFKSKPGEIVFYPFQQASITPIFFSRCEAFILPSIYEEWGLVVNEALLCSVPVLVSNRVGSSFNLVQDDVNGYTFNPYLQKELDELLELFILDKNLKSKLSNKSLEIMSEWGPKRFGDSGLKALNAALGD